MGPGNSAICESNGSGAATSARSRGGRTLLASAADEVEAAGGDLDMISARSGLCHDPGMRAICAVGVHTPLGAKRLMSSKRLRPHGGTTRGLANEHCLWVTAPHTRPPPSPPTSSIHRSTS